MSDEFQAEAEPADPIEDGRRGVKPLPWRRRLRRSTKQVIIIGVALAAAAVVSFITIDLGPTLRARAEEAFTAQIDRPVHIGRLATYLLPGRFVIENLVIEGLRPEDRPFFRADRLVISTSWLALLRGEVLVDAVDMGNWQMLVESFPGGRHNFPRFMADTEDDGSASTDAAVIENASAAPRRWFVTTVQYLRAHDGEFLYEDHALPWSATARHLDLTITKTAEYGGEVSFRDGTILIGSFEPMSADLDANYQLDGGLVHLTRIGLTMDGFESLLSGDVDLFNWPEQTYQIIESEIDLPTMKGIFFANDNFTVTGDAGFSGAWHIFDGGRELTGAFESDNATLNGLSFPRLDGSLIWTRDRFEVFDGASGFYGGNFEFTYAMQPLGAPTAGMASFETTYTGVELALLLDTLKVDGVRPHGRATGQNRLEWPIGDFENRDGAGHVTVEPPDGMAVLARGLTQAPSGDLRSYARVPFAPAVGPWKFPMGGELSYTVGPEWVEIAPSRLATPLTAVEFEGRTAYGERSHLLFHLSSANWQESDRLLAGIMTAFGTPTREFIVGGHGELDGVMGGSFVSPRIEAAFTGDDISAWNAMWGHGSGQITVENGDLDVLDGIFDDGTAQFKVEGRFAIGSRTDGDEEFNARFGFVSLPAQRVRDVFRLEGYHIDGPLTGIVHLFGQYRRPFGFGGMTLASPVAYGEPFDWAEADLRFEGDGVRVDGFEARKGDGVVTGAALIRWNGTYSVNVDGRDLAIDSIAAVTDPRVTLAGRLQFTLVGVGEFANPRYEMRGSIADLFVSNEIVGQVTGRADVRDGVLGLEVEAASSRLAISGSGRVDLMREADAELLFRFTNTTLDPYVRVFVPDLPVETTAVVSGTLRFEGSLRDVEQLEVDAMVEQLELTLFDYSVGNDGPVQIALARNVVRIERMQLSGEGTALELTGQVGLGNEQLALRTTGDANLGILQGFFSDIRSSGDAQLEAEIGGTFREPVITGAAEVTSGRLRHVALPHGVENVNGRVVFEPGGVRFDDLTGEIGDGPVRFGGQLGLTGYELGELDISAVGTGMRLRFPEGVRSLVDADLTLRGQVTDQLLTGTVSVQDAVWLDLFDPSTRLLEFAPDEVLASQPVPETIPLRFDVRISAPSSLRISDSTARIVSSAELTLGGTYDWPLLFGNAEIERGEVFFEGNRYRVTRGSIGFANPTAIEPFFDIEAETEVRVPGQTYRVTLGVSGTMNRLAFQLSSDPPLQEFEILSMLLGDVRDPQAAELRTLRAREASRQELFQAGAARLLTSPLSSGIGRVVEESFGVDTFEITPSLGDPSAQQSTQLLPSARLLIGQRISERAHVTLSRALTGNNRDLIVVLEYDQGDRLSWILSQNEDRTYALDFRVRHTF